MMKSNEIHFTVQVAVLLLILFSLMTGVISCQKDLTLDVDITEYDWELKSVSINSSKDNTPNGNHHHPDAYILKFESDSVFALPTNTNSMYGYFIIPTQGEITIYGGYSTQVGEGNHTAFNNDLRSALTQITLYEVRGRTLVFMGGDAEIEFNR